ncbi:protein of unknown function [Acidithiobacillus ferrivorans]|uniref:DNA-binding protein n=2 Tax=Acidithiobacillus ferrivorans TaxID=160808 RepID=A0ABY1MKH4_9PROT|nr:protein of unknown function [Acidithiobacillus ferrivorans]
MQKVSGIFHSAHKRARLFAKDTKKIEALAATARTSADVAKFYDLFNSCTATFDQRLAQPPHIPPRRQAASAPRGHRQAVRSSAKSGDSNSGSEDPDPEPEPERPLPQPQLFSFGSAAAILDCSPQTLRNKVCLGLIPAPIQTAVGPKFTQDQLRQITTPSTKPILADVPPVRRKAGRPRIAAAGKKGGAL